MTKSISLNEIEQIISGNQSFLLTGHVNPDGDCIGSMLSLGLALTKIGKDVRMYIEGELPSVYSFLPGHENVVTDLPPDFSADVGIAVDCNCQTMLGGVREIFMRLGKKIAIDHHEYRRPFADGCYVDHTASCVGEMVCDLVREAGIDIDKSIATNILTSLLIETNAFRFPSVNKKSFELAAYLLGLGVDYEEIVNNLFFSTSKEVAVLSGLCMSRCQFTADGRIAYSEIYKTDFHRQGGKDEHVDAVADEMRAIKGVEISVLFREKDGDRLRVSLRSKGQANVAVLAEKYGGGGHADVAGCLIENQAGIIDRFLNDAAELLQ